MNVANVGRIERGEGNPTLESIVRLAAVLEVTMADLTDGIGPGDVPSGRRRFTAAEFVRERDARS
jgi:transcriptional regulator with XRE-family HTH domain